MNNDNFNYIDLHIATRDEKQEIRGPQYRKKNPKKLIYK